MNQQFFKLGVNADRLLSLQGDLLALSSEKQTIEIIDVRDSALPVITGRFKTNVSTNVSQALISAGQLWMGGREGYVYDLVRQSGTTSLIYQPPVPRGFVKDAALQGGVFTTAADYYGAITYKQNSAGEWSEKVHPAPYAQSATQVEVEDRIRYLLQPDFLRVIALNEFNQESIILAGQPFSQLTVTDTMVVASAGNTLYMASRTNPQVKASLAIGAGDAIEAITGVGNTLYVSTAAGILYRVDTKGLPLDTTVVDITSILNSAEPLRHIAVDGDYIYYAVADVLHKLRLHDLNDTVLIMPGVISAIHSAVGRVWVGVQNQLHLVDASSMQLTTNNISTTANITSIDSEFDRVQIAQGADGMLVYRTALDWMSANPSLATPVMNKVYSQGQRIDLSMVDTDAVRTVRYLINGKQVSMSDQQPFTQNIAVPADLRNGQPFEITTQIETVWGELLNSTVRRVVLQGENLPANPFATTISLANSYLPKPLEIRAQVLDSTQAIQQVEFYFAANINGPFELLGKHYGPEFVLYRSFDEGVNGYIKSRAVDIYGNVTESQPEFFVRARDRFPPVTSLSVEGQKINGRLASGHPFKVNVTLDDEHSGVELALLYRNGLIIAAAFEDGVFSYNEQPANAGDTYNYLVRVQDRGGNVQEAAASFDIVLDNPAVIGTVDKPLSIIEQEPFDVIVDATDDLGIREIAVTWYGITTRKTYNTAPLSVTDQLLSIRDSRLERVADGYSETMTVKVIDTLGQETVNTFDIAVNKDTPPNASGINIVAPSNGFFNSNIALKINGLKDVDVDVKADEITSKLKVELIDVSTQPGKEVKTVNTRNRCVYSNPDCVKSGIRTPIDNGNNEQFSFLVRVTDRFGQMSNSPVSTIQLTQKPNVLQWSTDGDPVINRAFVGAGDSAPLRVRVLDVAGRPIPNMNLTWRIREPGSTDFVTLTRNETTDVNGINEYSLNTSRQTGTYQVRVSLTDYASFTREIAHNIEILPGPASELRFAYIPSLEPESIFNLAVQAYDAVGNAVMYHDNVQVLARIEAEGFNFGFTDQAVVENILGTTGVIGQQALITLRNGRAVIPMSASRASGNYQLQVSNPNAASTLAMRYDHDGSADTPAVSTTVLPLTVLPGAPARFSFTEVSQTNLVNGGDPERLEIGEVVTMQLTLVDEFFNPVTTVKNTNDVRIDADYSVDVTVTGEATVNGQVDSLLVSMDRGVATFSITDNTVEQVAIHIASIIPSPAGLDMTATHSLDFKKSSSIH